MSVAIVPNPSLHGQALPPGESLEEFVIERVLGSGGFGITYLARDSRLGRHVVIKENLPTQFCFRDPSSQTVSPRYSHGEDADNFAYSLESFEKEAAMLASLDHPGIVKVLRSFEANGTAYFVMPFVEGSALDDLLNQGRRFEQAELQVLLQSLLEALGYLHERGIYHRDIKPGNILITKQGAPVLIDFGAARQRLGEKSLTVIESAGYTPFEQLQTHGKIGPWSDLYALGATFYKVLTGETLAKAADRVLEDPTVPLANRAELRGRYSEEMLSGVDRATKPRLQERFQEQAEWQHWLMGVPKIGVLANEFFPEKALKAPLFTADCQARLERDRQGRRVSRHQSARLVRIEAMENKIGIKDADVQGSGLLARGAVGKVTEVKLPRDVSMRFVYCPPGDFTMGSPAAEEGHQKNEKQVGVTITRGFWIGESTVTRLQWWTLMGLDSRQSNNGKWQWQEFLSGNPGHYESVADLPVEGVSWSDAQEFVQSLNQTPAKPPGWKFVLPTEAQWEYACRAGESGAYSGGYLDEVAWYAGNSDGYSHHVALKKPNAWGLHDMLGNVYEWCSDWYEDLLNGGVDPTGPFSGECHVLRGGAAHVGASYCRSACRAPSHQSGDYGWVGFRVAMVRSF